MSQRSYQFLMYDGGNKYLVLCIRVPLSTGPGLCRILDLTFGEIQFHAFCDIRVTRGRVRTATPGPSWPILLLVSYDPLSSAVRHVMLAQSLSA
jgi:hypothetical protein